MNKYSDTGGGNELWVDVSSVLAQGVCMREVLATSLYRVVQICEDLFYAIKS